MATNQAPSEPGLKSENLPSEPGSVTQTSLIEIEKDGYSQDEMVIISGLKTTTIAPYQSKGLPITLKGDRSGKLSDGRHYAFPKGLTFTFNQSQRLWFPENQIP